MSRLYGQDVAHLDFDFAHGTVINNQYSNSYGITISVVGSTNSYGSNPNVGIVYDSELGGINGQTINGADPDLERLSAGGIGDGNATGWSGGNLSSNHDAGGLLIIQENPTFANSSNTNVTHPNGAPTNANGFNADDDAGGGVITFDIAQESFTYHYFNVTLADFEEAGSDYQATLSGVNGTVEVFNFASFGSTLPSGNNFIVALPEISLSTGEALDKVEITFIQSSGSVSNIVFSELPLVPEPSSVCLLTLGGLLFLRRNR